MLESASTWRGGRVVECTGFENRQARKGLGSSNLPLSADKLRKKVGGAKTLLHTCYSCDMNRTVRALLILLLFIVGSLFFLFYAPAAWLTATPAFYFALAGAAFVITAATTLLLGRQRISESLRAQWMIVACFGVTMILVITGALRDGVMRCEEAGGTYYGTEGPFEGFLRGGRNLHCYDAEGNRVDASMWPARMFK